MNNPSHDLYCQDLEGLLVECDEADPSPKMLDLIDRHIETCDVCRNAESTVSATVLALRATDPGSVNETFEQRLLSRLCQSGEAFRQSE